MLIAKLIRKPFHGTCKALRQHAFRKDYERMTQKTHKHLLKTALNDKYKKLTFRRLIQFNLKKQKTEINR